MTWKTLKFSQLSVGVPIVYMWFRGKQCLYVGMSTQGIGRPLAGSHHTIGKCEEVQGHDKLYWVETPTIELAKLMESALIAGLQPKHNSAGTRRKGLAHPEIVKNVERQLEGALSPVHVTVNMFKLPNLTENN